jgi:hypothetical protein
MTTAEKPKKPRCSARVSHGFRQFPCSRTATTKGSDGKGYCKQHNIDAVAKQRDEQAIKWQAEHEAFRKMRLAERAAPVLLAALKGGLDQLVGPAYAAAIEAIKLAEEDKP